MENKENIVLKEIPTDIVNLLSTGQAWEYQCVPFAVKNNHIHFYTVSINQSFADELEILLGSKVEFELLGKDEIQQLLNRYYRKNKERDTVKQAHSTDFLEQLIGEAQELKSSDIHIEAFEEKSRVRMRIDGKLIERYVIKKADYPSFVNKIKIKAKLDIAEKRLPQDGRIVFEQGKSKLDIRVSVLPTLHGEKVVMRLLSNDATNIDINALGFEAQELKNYLEAAKKPNGIILISGPTGSGKTTTLYATLKLLNQIHSNIVTIEDPIEYTLEGINQVQLREDIGLTFSRALRTFLRQDPDVIMLGEIRDSETANMAIRASLTGHLVLSTIHTNSAWGTITRLIDMGVPPFLLASTINTSVAQRLARKLCPHCKREEKWDNKNFPSRFKPSRALATHYVSVGCDTCYFTGYKGRIAIYEVIPFDYELGELIKKGIFDARLELKQRGVRFLSENAFDLLENGTTSIDEVYSLLMDV